MIVYDPTEININLFVIPRYYNVNNPHIFNLTNKNTDDSFNLSLSGQKLLDGYIKYQYTNPSELQIAQDNTTFNIKITDSVTSNIIWRGQLFLTTQDTQEYKING